MKKISTYFLSWDMFLGLIALMIGITFVPENIDNTITTAIYSTAISVLSIIFSIFFASLAVIMAFPDNEFIVFIEKGDMLFTRILGYFKATLFILFVSLVLIIIFYIYSSLALGDRQHNRTIFLAFIFIFTYSLIATFIAVDITLKLTQSRSKFLAKRLEEENQVEVDTDGNEPE